jgi:hypothetical protein
MGKRRSDADYRRFFDEFLCVKIPRLRATGAVQLEAPHTIIQFGHRRKLIGLAHTKFRHGGSWSYFRCPKCGRRANRLWLIEDRPHCVKSCNGPNIWHRTKWGFGRRERLKAKDKAFIASRRRAHPVRRSWAAGRRLPGDLGRYEEAYLIESWLELMHLRERVTNADRVLEDEIREMLIAPTHRISHRRRTRR